MDPFTATVQDELCAWLPRLIRLWRRESKSRWSDAPADRLLPAEAKSVAAGLARLSQGLTRERPLAGEAYFSDPSQAGAYLLYFWPVSFAQARLALSLLPAPPRSVLELGSAAGPLSAAAAGLGCRAFHLVDRSPRALEWGRLLLQAQGATATVSQQDLSRNMRLAGGPYDLIAAQHACNELWLGGPDRADKIAGMFSGLKDRLSGQGNLLLIEPALKATSRAALQVRDRLLQSGWAARFPCLHQQPCPTLAAGDSCHAESEWSAPQAVQSLWRRAGLAKRVLKMTLLLFSPDIQAPAGPERWLAISEPRRLRTREIEVPACGAGGRVAFRLAPADAADGNRALFKLKPGEIFTVDGAEPPGPVRRLGPAARVELAQTLAGLKIKA